MKLLGWMHQKIRQRSMDPFKDFTIGNCCTCLSAQPSPDDPLFYPKPSHSSKPFLQNHSEYQLSISEINSKNVEDLEEVLSDGIPDFFHGFLTIGTLGLKPILSEPPTPTFGMSYENIVEMEIEVMENDLKVINDELDKFLEAEAKEEGCDESSGRNSYVSNVTLSSKQMEGADSDEYGKMEICPLQGYLFGSSIELPDSRSRTEAKKEKASLRELFQMTKIAEEHSELNYERGDMQAKGKYKSNMPLLKKMLKRLHNSSGDSTKSAGSDASHSVSVKSKIHKILRMFRRKIHPESSTAAEEFKKSHKHSTHSQSAYHNEDYLPYEDIIRFPQGSWSKGGVQCPSYISSLPQNRVSSSNISGNKENWIKTDADYLVLEL